MPEHAPRRPLQVSIVEDDEEIRAHLALLISQAADLVLSSAHGSAEEAVRTIPEKVPDVVLMDINLPGMSGIECARTLKDQFPTLQILMLTVYEDGDRIFESLKAGASGYLLKRTPGPRLLEAIRDVHEGGAPMTSQIARKVVQHFNHPPAGNAAACAVLSAREREVLEQLARGRLYKEIAESLKVSLDTVRKHLQSIYQKLHVHTRTEAVIKFLKP